MNFPVAIVADRQIIFVTTAPEPFTGHDGTKHPSFAWEAWEADDWAKKCPGWAVLPVVDATPPTDLSARVERLPVSEWIVSGEAVTVAYRVTERPETELAAMLAISKSEATARVNQEAGDVRSRYITVATGQEGTYSEKGREAREYFADPAPDPARYPYLAAEAEYTGKSLAEVAAIVKATADAWTAVNAEIEGRRRGACERIAAAGAIAEVEAIFPIAWPTQ